ncbi:MAG: helix-turn-helix transcriptional regulator [Candidatus Thorarchaeota archaeon]
MVGMLKMGPKRTRTIIIVTGLALPAILLGFAIPVQGQPVSQQLTLRNMRIEAQLGLNGTTYISVETEVFNNGSVPLDYFDLRIDIRSMGILESLLDSNNVDTTLVEEDRYTLLRVFTASPLLPNESIRLSVSTVTDTLQQRAGEIMTEPEYVDHFIYYLRPLNEIHNLTFTALLPPHATLEEGAAAPLFPLPNRNYTDGIRLAFAWETEVLYPGQELAFIVKYQAPIGLIQTQIADGSLPIFMAAAAVAGALIVLTLERLPSVVQSFRSRTGRTVRVVSSQEQHVLSLLDRKGGSCLQREVYEELDMSQSMASMLLNSLEERGLIKRFREGRENVVHKIDD